MTTAKKFALCLVIAPMTMNAQANPFFDLMQKAAAHAKEHHALVPALSPVDATILNGQVPVAALQTAGITVVPWTTNDPEKMRAVIRTGVDGLISDRPDLLQKVVAEERAAKPGSLKGFDVQGHRGGRGLRPENTLPAFEGGLDNLISTIETDTGVTADHVSIIWHDQFLNPQSCRKADGSEYTLATRQYHREITMADAQKTFICDKLHSQFPDQKNDLALSPVAVAFAAKEKLISPYVPTYVEQLFRFVAFYEDYYRHGAGKNQPEAAARAANAARVHFNLETKILPEDLPAPPADSPMAKYAEMMKNHTFGPQVFVDTLCGAIAKHHMEARVDVQSFDFRTLVLVEEQYPKILTFYLTESQDALYGPMLPVGLRATK
ncbi:glycerophosphoryl diester phosphodiesterase [Granulicella pectinivorans]|uniref:Glycerophosphoryl diester phosphodiesterase n=1 Tax=Granulicella pectinivorans TaxID=474950 RepID=A0A1I6LTM8_9BACT|nr:glycerophosphodiester phosphodiesterase family protein [Granulicella pectinivorans]SFS06766.1 glycerophosphoryl diester phosphodiesterase [Granulicella pectinivorans]